MNTKYNVSIIIPVYNAEKYLEKCVQSLISQTYKSLEIIFINDGSTDKSMDILKLYSEKYNNIVVLDQNNMGQGEARNRGIDKARGEFITFADSDDWLSIDYVECLFNAINDNEADISVCNMIKVIEDTGEEIKSQTFTFKELTNEKALRQLLLDRELKSYPWGKMYKKKLFTENNIRFPKNMFYEDLATIFQVFFFAQKVAITNSFCYYYLQTRESSTRTPNPKNISDRLQAIGIIKKFLVRNLKFDYYKEEFKHFCLFHLFLMARQIYLWKLKISYEKIINDIENLIEVDYLDEDIINNTTLSNDEKTEIKMLIKNIKIYKLCVTMHRIKDKVM